MNLCLTKLVTTGPTGNVLYLYVMEVLMGIADLCP